MASRLARKDETPAPAVDEPRFARRETPRGNLDPLVLALARAVDRQAAAPTSVPRAPRAE